MARRVKDFEFVETTGYPWIDWTDGSVWEIKRGEDFTCSADSMRAQLYARATNDGSGAQVRVARQGDTITFQFFKITANPDSGDRVGSVN